MLKAKIIEVPEMMESITEGTVFEFHKQIGDYVKTDDLIAVLETDKVKLDIRSPVSGILIKMFVNINDQVEVGKPFFEIDTSAVPEQKIPHQDETPKPHPDKISHHDETPKPHPDKISKPSSSQITKKQTKASTTEIPQQQQTTVKSKPAFQSREERRVQMSKIRQTIAKRLKESQDTYAQLTTFQEVDMSSVMQMRQKHQQQFQKKHNIKLGFMSFFIKGQQTIKQFLQASVVALQEIPSINAVIQGTDIIYRDYCDISVAVSTPSGLLVPVVRNCESLSFAEIEKNLLDLANKGKNGQITLEDMVGGGIFGSLMGTPILNPPQSAIMGMHAIINKPVVVNEQIVVRPMMNLALTYDHRLIDVKNKLYNASLENKYGCKNYGPVPVVIKKAKGVYMWDVEDNKYIDALSSYSAVNQGHCHPLIIQALVEQAQKVTLTSRAFYNSELGVTEKYLCDIFGYDKVLLMNSGVEGGESAIKIARRWAYDVKGVPDNQAKVLFAVGNFWGRTLAACASSDDPSRYDRFGPFNMNFELIPYNDVQALEEAFKADPNIAAYMLEPIQGERGVIIPDSDYLAKVRDLCTKYNVLMICDEVQTGLGRTGKLLATQHEEDVKPDILVLGKALSGGVYPVSAVFCNNEIMNVIQPGDHGSTYGGNSLACAVSRKAIEVLFTENMIENSQEMGDLLKKNLMGMCQDGIVDIRGRGLFCAVQFQNDMKKSAFDFCGILMKNGVLAKNTHDNTIRFSPPLVIDNKQIEVLSDRIEKSLTEYIQN